ncbi:MAG: GDYXXLXY domain-containing protein [Myxococcales bacterium]|nr:GDYXXLXY domain-containing protein [Myxococcales bacterium]
MNRWLLGGGLLLALGAPAASVVDYERHVQGAEPMLLELAPVDPRSLIQGDYMVLSYAITRSLRREVDESWPRTGTLAVTVDERGVVTDARLLTDDGLQATERALDYRLRHHQIRLGAESFFFQEGNAEHYEQAEYGELRVDASGRAVLVGLRDEALQILGPAGDHPLQ